MREWENICNSSWADYDTFFKSLTWTSSFLHMTGKLIKTPFLKFVSKSKSVSYIKGINMSILHYIQALIDIYIISF